MDQQQRGWAIYRQAVNLPEQRRQAFIDNACGDDVSLREFVLGLFAAESAPTLKPDNPQSMQQDGMPIERIGDTIDHYKLIEKIGEGGFGVVYLAEQTAPVRRRVALKVIKVGMDTRQVIARFEAERQALAMMDHPNIAKVLDAGATATGRPFFVMELVRGVPLTDYCDRNDLSTRQRLELFIDICAAVQHAHQKGIIHRDLKPSNVLVAIHDDRPVPKIIDFGIAKATSAELAGRTIFTEQQQLIGTPEYMSPEQAEMSGLDIDARTDIYSLGVLLYELLTGTLPFDTVQLRQAGLFEIQRIIREEDPPRPSHRLSSLLTAASGIDDEEPGVTTVRYIARHRRTDPTTLARQLRGDLDWIIMRAIEKDRTRRYPTANALAEDIRRHLNDEPVLAGPPSTTYRLGKMFRRHRGRFIAAGLVAAAILLGLAGTTAGLIRAIDSADRAHRANVQLQQALAEAEEQRDIARAVSSFLNEDLLASLDPAQAGKDVSVRQVLDAASTQLHSRFADQPAVRATLHHTIGTSYMALGLYDEAETHLATAATMREAMDSDSRDTIIAYGNLAGLYVHWDHHGKARELLEHWLEVAQTSLGADDPITLGLINNLAAVLNESGQYQQAEQMLTDALQRQERVLGSDHGVTIKTLGTLANVANRAGDHEGALRLFREVERRMQQSLGVDHPDTLITRNNIANCLLAMGDVAAAVPVYEETLRARREQLGEEHPDTLTSAVNLARCYWRLDRPGDATALAEKTLSVARRVLGPQHTLVRSTSSLLGNLYLQSGRVDDAQTLLVQMLRDTEALLGQEHVDAIECRIQLLALYQHLGRTDDAEQLAREHVAILHAAASKEDCDPQLLNTAAWELATFSDVSLRDPEAAVRFAQRACEATKNRNGYYLDTLAVATAAAGDPARAIDIQQQALALVAEDDPGRPEMLAHLQQFEAAIATNVQTTPEQPADIQR